MNNSPIPPRSTDFPVSFQSSDKFRHLHFTGRLAQLSLIVFTATLLLSASFLQPAFAERKPVAFGLVGGLTGASFWGDQVKEFNMAVWPTTGFTLALHLPVFLGLETDLLYVSKSGSILTYAGGYPQPNVLTLHGLEMPLLLKVTAPTGSEVTPIFFAGPSVAYFFKKDSYADIVAIDTGGTVQAITGKPLIAKDDLVDFDYSFCFGGGVEWGLGSFQIRFNLGQNSLDKTKRVDVKTAVVAIMAGFIF